MSSIAQPAEIPLTLGEQVRAKGLAVLTAIDPETEPEPSSSSVQAAIAQGQHNRNTDRMLASTRVPPGNLQDNPDYKGAYTALFELPERFGVDMATVSAISQGLIVSYEAVSFYEKALLRVEQQLFEQTETQARLHEEMYKNDELSSIVQAQDEHKLRLEEAHINAENAHRVFEEDMIRRLQEAEEANREISSNLEKEKQEKASISRLLQNRDNQMSSEISDLTISRQEALLQYEFACTQHSDDIRAIRQDNQRLREQLLEAYRMRDDYHQLVSELSSQQPADREVHMAEYITVKNKLWSAESELNRVVQQLEQSQESRRGIRQNLAQLQERYTALDREKNELTLRLAYLQGATQAARELLEEERLEQEELHARADSRVTDYGPRKPRLWERLRPSLLLRVAICLLAIAKPHRLRHLPSEVDWTSREMRQFSECSRNNGQHTHQGVEAELSVSSCQLLITGIPVLSSVSQVSLVAPA